MRYRESLAGLNQPQHLTVGQTLEGKAAKSDHLIEQNTITPDVRHRGEQSIYKGLSGHPTYR